jgi:DNA repair protein RadA/Sms
MELRLKEAAKLGFKRAIVPKGQSYPDDLGLELIPVSKVIDAIVAAIPPQRRFGGHLEAIESDPDDTI